MLHMASHRGRVPDRVQRDPAVSGEAQSPDFATLSQYCISSNLQV